jgi:hypothetical protein
MHEFWRSGFCIPRTKENPSPIAEHFRSFYLGFNPKSIIWFAYRDDDTYFETTFNFDDIHKDDEDRLLLWKLLN